MIVQRFDPTTDRPIGETLWLDELLVRCIAAWNGYLTPDAVRWAFENGSRVETQFCYWVIVS